MFCQIHDHEGKALDASFELTSSHIDFHSRGGSKKSGTQRNSDYGPGLRLLLTRLYLADLDIKGIWVDSTTVQTLPINTRQVLTNDELKQDPVTAFTLVSNRMVTVGQSKNTRGGNSTKKIKIEFNDLISRESLQTIANALMGKTNEEYSEVTILERLLEKGRRIDDNFDIHYTDRLRSIGETDGMRSQATSRKEQHILHAILFKKNTEAQCAICNRTFPTDLMVAAHIKPRRDCNPSERTNPNVVMPLCKMGCDDLFEKGYILVDEFGVVRANNQKLVPLDLNRAMREITGKKCTHFNSETADLFNSKRLSVEN
jgi:5-methylcytosine-specific restriction endonuclease McrA